MGRFKVYGQAWDTCLATQGKIDLSPDYLVIKRAARLRLTAARRGRYAHLRARARKYDGGYPTWAADRGATVSFQRYYRHRSHRLATRRVGRSGSVSLTFRHARRPPTARSSGTPTVWGRTSRRLRK